MTQAARLLKIVFSELSKSANEARMLPPKRHYDYLKARDFSYDIPEDRDLKEIKKAIKKVQREPGRDRIEEMIDGSRRFSMKRELGPIKLRLAQIELLYSNLKEKGADEESLRKIEDQIERIKAMIY